MESVLGQALRHGGCATGYLGVRHGVCAKTPFEEAEPCSSCRFSFVDCQLPQATVTGGLMQDGFNALRELSSTTVRVSRGRNVEHVWVCETELYKNAVRISRNLSDAERGGCTGVVQGRRIWSWFPAVLAQRKPRTILAANARRDASCCGCSSVSAFLENDTYLTVRFQEHLPYHEQNPVRLACSLPTGSRRC